MCLAIKQQTEAQLKLGWTPLDIQIRKRKENKHSTKKNSSASSFNDGCKIPPSRNATRETAQHTKKEELLIKYLSCEKEEAN
jgi:hypothetical protein